MNNPQLNPELQKFALKWYKYCLKASNAKGHSSKAFLSEKRKEYEEKTFDFVKNNQVWFENEE